MNMFTRSEPVSKTMDYRARGSWIGNAHAALFLMYGVSACL